MPCLHRFPLRPLRSCCHRWTTTHGPTCPPFCCRTHVHASLINAPRQQKQNGYSLLAAVRTPEAAPLRSSPSPLHCRRYSAKCQSSLPGRHSSLSRLMPLSVSRGAELKIFSEASLRCAAPPLPLWCLNGSSELRPLPGPTATPSSILSSLLTSSNSKSTPVTSGLSHHRQVPITDHRHRRDLNTVSPLLPEPLNPIHRLAIAL